MPPKNKASARSGKTGKALRKQNPPLLTSESGGEEDEPSVWDMLRNMTEMMTLLDRRLGTVEGDNRKKRKVAYHGETSTTRSLAELQHLPDVSPGK